MRAPPFAALERAHSLNGETCNGRQFFLRETCRIPECFELSGK
jgi:hypothetical protein